MPDKLRTISSLPLGTYWLFFKAVLISGIVRFTLLFLPFNKVLRWLGTPGVETAENISDRNIADAQAIKTAVWLCNKYTPWKTECYVQALTARILLRQGQISSTIYIGFKKNNDDKIEGHAWIRAGNLILTGNKIKHEFKVHSFFS